MPKEKSARRNAAKQKRIFTDKPGGFVLPSAADSEDYRLGRMFLDDPKEFLKKTNLKLSDLVCREQVHTAIQNGEAFGDAVFALGGTATDIKMLEPVKKLAAKHFGPDYEVAMIPYGLQFGESFIPVRGGGGVPAGGLTPHQLCPARRWAQRRHRRS